MFLKIGDVKGESKDTKHKNEIDLISWNWGMSNPGSMHTGGGGGAGKVNVSDISLTKAIDKASPVLMALCCDGKVHPKAEIVMRKASGKNALEYYKLLLEDVLITSVSAGGSGGDTSSENVTLNFAKFKVEYQAQKNDGSPDGGVVSSGWNIEENKAH